MREDGLDARRGLARLLGPEGAEEFEVIVADRRVLHVGGAGADLLEPVLVRVHRGPELDRIRQRPAGGAGEADHGQAVAAAVGNRHRP